MPERKHNNLLPIATAGIAGAVAYKFLRKPRFATGTLGKLQRESKGKLWVADYDKYDVTSSTDVLRKIQNPTWFDKLKTNIATGFGDIQKTTSKDLVKKKHEGAVLFYAGGDRVSHNLPKVPRENYSVGIHADSDRLVKLDDKVQQSRLLNIPKEHAPKSEYLATTRNFFHKDDESNIKFLQNALNTHAKKFNSTDLYIKPTTGRASGVGAANPHEKWYGTFKNFEKFLTNKSPKAVEQRHFMAAYPKDMMIQPMIRGRKVQGLGGPVEQEFRVHTVDGKVISTSPRFNVVNDRLRGGLKEKYYNFKFEHGQPLAKRKVQNFISQIGKSTRVKNPDDVLINAYDVMIDTAGKPKIIETNTGASGFFSKTLPQHYKAITGRATKTEAGAKALGAAALAGTGTALLAKKIPGRTRDSISE